MARPEPEDVTQLLQSWNSGDKGALSVPVLFVYRALRSLAAPYIHREAAGPHAAADCAGTPGLLEAGGPKRVESPSRAQFFAIAAKLMRQILVNDAKQHRTSEPGGGNKVALEEGAAVVQQRGVDLTALDEALDKLAQLDPRQNRTVALRFLGWLTEGEIAEVLGVSAVTVTRDWRITKAFLHRQLGADVMPREEQP